MPFLPIITCHLTDKCEKIISPYSADALKYTELTHPNTRPDTNEICADKNASASTAFFSIEGFIAVYADGRSISPPIPFRIIKELLLYAPKGTFLGFQTVGFASRAHATYRKQQSLIEQVRIEITIETVVNSEKNVCLILPEVDQSLQVIKKVCISTVRIFDSVMTQNETCLSYTITPINAEVYQYNALSDGKRGIYTNDDELTQYGDRGILSPENTSFYSVFINGVLQPKTNYLLTEGELSLTTTDIPPKGQPVIISYVTFKSHKTIRVSVYQYNAVSDGLKKQFTNDDELKEYGCGGIPSPAKVSYFNLYVNGVLQPKTTYDVFKGRLILTTTVPPPKGAIVSLEALTIRDSANYIMPAQIYQYSALSHGNKIYTDSDELIMYGNHGISAADKSSVQNLFVNGVIQPDITYQITEGLLTLNTDNAPIKGAPVILQYLSVYKA